MSLDPENSEHNFKHDRTSNFCYFCQNTWPANGSVVSEYNTCSNCGLCVHAACTSLSKLYCKCLKDNSLSKKLSSIDLQRLNQNGVVYCIIKQSYDLNLTPGTSIYGKYIISSSRESHLSPIAVIRDNDCIWPNSDNTSTSNEANSNSAVQESTTTSNTSQALHHIVPVTASGTSPPLIAPPWVEVQIWRSVFGIFDSIIGVVRVSLLPLMLNHSVSMERWFGIRNSDKEACGVILLQLCFVPDESKKATSTAIVDHVHINELLVEKSNNNEHMKVDTPNIREIEEDNCHSNSELVHIVNEKNVVEDNVITEDNKMSEEMSILHVDTNKKEKKEKKERKKSKDESGEKVRRKKHKSTGDNEDPNAVKVKTHKKKKKEHSKEAEESAKADSGPGVDDASQSTEDKQAIVPTQSTNNKLSKIASHPAAIAATAKINEFASMVSSSDFGKWTSKYFSEFSSNAKVTSLQVLETVTTAAAVYSGANMRLRDARRKKKEALSNADDANAAQSNNTGVGTIYVHLISAYKTVVNDAADGDFYVVVSINSGGSEPPYDEDETQVVTDSAAPVFNKKFEFIAPHYRTIVTFTLVENATERKIGIAHVKLFAIIQRDADAFGRLWSDFPLENIQMKDMSGKDVIGHFTAQILFKEDIKGLFMSLEPRSVPMPPQEQMSLERLRVHVTRFKGVIDAYMTLYRSYRRLMDWERPLFTLVVFVLFVISVLKVDAEYALSLPLFLVVILLSDSMYYRYSGAFRRKWIEVEDDFSNMPYRPLAYLRIAVTGFRHLGIKDKSPHASVPPYVRIALHPDKSTLPTKDKSQKNTTVGELLIATFATPTGMIGRHHQSGSASHSHPPPSTSRVISSVANTGRNLSQIISSLNITRSENMKDAMLHNVSDPWPRSKLCRSMLQSGGSSLCASNEDSDVSFLYPLLQPLAVTNTTTSSAKDVPSDNTTGENGTPKKPNKSSSSPFVPWNEIEGKLKVSLHGDNPLGSFIDTTWGHFYVSLKDLVDPVDEDSDSMTVPSGVQSEICRWYTITWNQGHLNRLKGEQNTSGARNDELDGSVLHNTHERNGLRHLDHNRTSDSSHRHNSDSSSRHPSIDESMHPPTVNDGAYESQVLLRIQLDIRHSRKDPLEEEVEISRIVQTMLNPNGEKSETAISAIWNARDHITYVQNLLGSILNNAESFKNIFNWTCPSKTLPIYVTVVVIWIASIFIQGRYLILTLGLSEFLYKFMPQPEGATPMLTRYFNLLECLPNDDDLSQYYEEERSVNSRQMTELRRKRWKQAKLRLVLECEWDSHVKLKCDPISGGSGSSWMDIFLVVQGHRLVWWATEEDIDNGKAPIGELLLQGHAGITHASPVDIREIGPNRLVAVFGRDAYGTQERRTFMCQDSLSCEQLSNAVMKVLGLESAIEGMAKTA